ncbi:MAG: hypothetical protein R3236_03475 [Phycisphaeraceae bacterium]|nr:hypothetical protein [Phycisphaeraceae bacterium]
MIRFSRNAAFSLIEMLLVLGIILVLLAIMAPVLLDKSVRTSYTVTCASNESQIFKASMVYKVDRGQDGMISLSERFDPAVWPDIFSPFVDDATEVFICPEDPSAGPGMASGPDDWWGAINNSRWVHMNEGIFHRKLSGEQLRYVIDKYGDRDGSWGKYFKGDPPDYPGYIPDGTGEFLLGVEDAGWPNEPGGDQDFNDMVVRVVPQADGTVHIYGRRWSSAKWSLYYGPDREDIFNMAGKWGFGTWEGPFVLPGGKLASYGINAALDIDSSLSGGGKIYMIDYMKTDVRPDPVGGDDCESWRSTEGRLHFARHIGWISNVLFEDGSVRQLDPDDLNPAFVDTRLRFWEP